MCPWWHSLTLHLLAEYLVLEDLTATFSKPSILDLKLGKRVWDDFADQEKIDRELKKYPAQETLGFRIIGMRVRTRTEVAWGCMYYDCRMG